MAPRDAQVSTDEAIQNLKTLLGTLQSVNESMTTEMEEIRGQNDEREKFVNEIDHEIEDLTRRLKEYDDKVEQGMNAVESNINEDFKYDFFIRIQDMTQAYHQEVDSTIILSNDTHASLQSAHEQFISAHEDYMHVELESLEVTSGISDDTNAAYEALHTSLQEAKEHAESHVAEAGEALTGATAHLAEDAVNTASEVFDALVDAVTGGLMDTSTETWSLFKERCENCTSDFSGWVDTIATETDGLGREALESLGKHLDDQLKSPLEQLFDKAREDGVASVMDEVAELLNVMGVSTTAAAALSPLLPALCVVEAVLDAFEKILEALTLGD
ncbi:MAG: hypothetical protein ACR2IE_10555 [Candidatus Sumerlaeaceae bacterium]